MPTLKINQSIPAGSVEPNLMTGSKFEQLPFPAQVSVYAVCADDVGGTGAQVDGDVILDVTMGSVIEGDQLSVTLQDPAVTGEFAPLRNRHLIASGVASAHDRLQLKVTNGNATKDAKINALVEIRPL